MHPQQPPGTSGWAPPPVPPGQMTNPEHSAAMRAYLTSPMTAPRKVSKAKSAVALVLYFLGSNAIVGAAVTNSPARIAWTAVAAVCIWQGTLWIVRGQK